MKHGSDATAGEHLGSTAGQDAGEQQLAARHLMSVPILTGAKYPEQLALIRRHSSALKSMFMTQLGYALIVEATFARLIKGPLDITSPSRPARRPSDGQPFSAATYAHLALICAALLAPGVGEQVLISALVDQVRADAAEQSITMTDSINDRRQLVTALGLLISWGVLTQTDGSVTAWGERRQNEALLSVNRALLAHLLPAALHDLDDPDDLVQRAAGGSPRRRLRRRLAENPTVFRGDLPEDELDVLSRERSELARALEENFGLVLEVRAEGALAYDATGQLTDIDFPGAGSLKQAALLLLDELIAQRQPGSDSTTVVDGRIYPGALARWVDVDRTLTALVARYRSAWKNEYTGSIDKLKTDIAELLTALGLAAVVDSGLVVFPFAARYRPTVAARGSGSDTPDGLFAAGEL